MRQATAARAVIGKPLGESAPEADRTYGAGAGRPVDLLVLGDSLPDDYAAHVAVVVVGGNDVTHRVPVERSVAQLVRAVLVLRERGPTVGPFFAANPDEMFSVDQFHPSAAGYRRTAKAMLPSVLAALGEPEAEGPVRFGHHVPTGPDAGRQD